MGAGSGVDMLYEAHQNRIPVEGKVIETCKGGFRVQVMGQTAFCPVSQMDVHYVEKPEEFVGAVFPFLIERIEARGKNLVVNRRRLLEQEQAEQRARQRELELLHVARLSTLGEMASGLAHELSQPLSSIVNYSTACAQLGAVDRPDLQRIMKNIHKITEQAERARDIMVRIRELAQRRRPRLTSVDVNRVVANVLDLLSWQIRQKGIDLNPDLDDRLPAARADAIQVEQVLVNLTRNAIEAMEQTPPRRRLTIRTSPGDAGAVRIEVSDTGVGIPRDEPDRIFDAFCTTKADGLGIGLSISRTIVEMHEGILQADRNAEGGSTFVVVLPQVPRQDATEGRDEDWQRDASHGMPWLSRSANGSLKKMAGSIR